VTAGSIRVRAGTSSDVARLLPVYDQAVAWLVSHGRAGQWGTEPWSAQPRLAAKLRRLAGDGDLLVAEIGADPAGVLCLTRAPRYVPPASEPELYLEGFVVDRRYAGRGVGRALLDEARELAAGRGARQLRLDCWAGGDQALIRYYERAGFTVTARFTLAHVRGGWEGAVLTRGGVGGAPST
jgi:ribosomal protein S18 acetylase RimI-like enzyme